MRACTALQSPPTSDGLSSSEALSFPSVQLFVESAAEAINEFVLSDEDAPVVAEIRSKLDGNPLAIKLVAAAVDLFGVSALATRLANPLRLLTSRCRNTPSRHQSMTAALDWSYQLLSEPERSLLRRLALFSGGFSVAAASAVAADEIAALDVLACLANLVSKSIVNAGLSGSTVCYRLPLITRAYALEKLVESGEFEQVREAIKQAEQTIADCADGLNGGVRGPLRRKNSKSKNRKAA